MADNALRNEPPLGRLRDFTLATHEGRPDTLDIKINGAALFVDAARILSLAVGDTHTGTAERLRAAAQARKLDDSEVEGWIDAFHFVQSLRLAHQQSQIESGDRRRQLPRAGLAECARSPHPQGGPAAGAQAAGAPAAGLPAVRTCR